MLDSDHRAADGDGRREDRVDSDGGHEAPPASAGPAADATGGTQAPADQPEDDYGDGIASDSDSYSWTSTESGGDLADDAVVGPSAAHAGAGGVAAGVVPFGLADPRRHLSPAPTFGNVAVANSTDVQFGNKTFFNGPVTIKQVVYAKDVDGATVTAVPAAGSGAPVAHVDPANPNKAGVVAEGVRVKVLAPTVVSNGNAKPARANGAAPSTISINSSESEVATNCCKIPFFCGAGKPGDGEGARRSCWQRMWKTPRERNMALCGAAAALVLVGGVMSVASALVREYSRVPLIRPPRPELPTPWNTTETNRTLSGKLYIIPRREWLAQPRLGEAEFLKLPVPYVIISHSASEGCTTQAACTQMVRYIQTFHIESRGWADIAYNFLVGGDGYVYEGRGWKVIGAHTFGYNNRSIGLNVVGTFITELPNEAQIRALKQLIELGVENNCIAKNYKLMAHRQLSATESPGTMFYEELKTWPHWSQNP